MTRRQCKKCPWKVSVDPYDIPDGYCEEKHARLQSTIAQVWFSGRQELRMMACHEFPVGHEKPCVGWMKNQLGSGNNVPLRIACMKGLIDAEVETAGEQHERFEETLPEQAV